MNKTPQSLITGAVAYESFLLQSLSHSSSRVSQRWPQLEPVAQESGHKVSFDCISFHFTAV